ncbi:hypothetical protein [Geoalkalibacter sp.]|uniref:hypothetical protein n=1 Tax=Geoalkalibacter sp. TaxID=3041440 RepID=UPI00272E8F25|nr:hypothetical protein [Geoalkalibacter sp.]
MTKWFRCLFVAFLLSLPHYAMAAGYEVRPGIEISFAQLPSSWQVSTEPPDFLVAEHAGHIEPEQLAAARKAGVESPEEAARQMLRANELYLYNPRSGAHLMIDFSPLREGETAPSARALKTSARYAAEGLSDEEGFEAVSAKVGKTRIKGAGSAYRIDADFLKHGEATRFIGIITFALDHWVYLYYTGPQSAQDDLATANQVLKSFGIARQD